ncbi:MAG: hypothetical protein ABSG65_10840 [Bryobacteraceae bacterium]
MSQLDDAPLGILAAVEFTNGAWCKERWQPRHLTDLASLKPKRPERAENQHAKAERQARKPPADGETR